MKLWQGLLSKAKLQAYNKGITNDVLAMYIRQAFHHLSEIIDEITEEEIPSGMFGTFCIGKWLFSSSFSNSSQ
jgi:tRNA U34 5-carboxymethylaminomethyl modifying GTPase MnmE/TrmE